VLHVLRTGVEKSASCSDTNVNYHLQVKNYKIFGRGEISRLCNTDEFDAVKIYLTYINS
jgi:hypothetical protein